MENTGRSHVNRERTQVAEMTGYIPRTPVPDLNLPRVDGRTEIAHRSHDADCRFLP